MEPKGKKQAWKGNTKHASIVVAQGKALGVFKYDGYHAIYQPHDCLLNYI